MSPNGWRSTVTVSPCGAVLVVEVAKDDVVDCGAAEVDGSGVVVVATRWVVVEPPVVSTRTHPASTASRTAIAARPLCRIMQCTYTSTGGPRTKADRVERVATTIDG
jgi:hypothetical protein